MLTLKRYPGLTTPSAPSQGGFAASSLWRSHPSSPRRGTPFPAIHSHLHRAPVSAVTDRRYRKRLFAQRFLLPKLPGALITAVLATLHDLPGFLGIQISDLSAAKSHRLG